MNDMQVRISKEGQCCRKCNAKVVKVEHKSNWKPKQNQPYYFTYWFKCPNCRTIYLVDSAKKYLNDEYRSKDIERFFNDKEELELQRSIFGLKSSQSS